jgi:F-type H+-transporting ATPase subunit delta
MAELTTIARPYAEAAFELARSANALPAWSSMLRYVSAVVAEPAMARSLDNPKFTPGDKESLILSVCGEKLDAMGRRFVRVLVEADRVAVLPQIAALFDELKNDVHKLKPDIKVIATSTKTGAGLDEFEKALLAVSHGK